MAQTTNPVTGLPEGEDEVYAHQIPLSSSPVLAPEWHPLGKYRKILHPDNIPTVFGTLQAHNDKKPGTVQALSTNGKGALKVAPEAGSQSAPSQSFNTGGVTTDGSGWQTWGGSFSRPKLIWAFLFFIGPQTPLPTAPIQGGWTLALQSNPSGVRFGFATGFFMIPDPATSTADLAYVANIWLPNPLDMTTAFPDTDTDAEVGIATTLSGLGTAVSIVYESDT